MLQAFVRAVRELERQGACAITTSCGFLGIGRLTCGRWCWSAPTCRLMPPYADAIRQSTGLRVLSLADSPVQRAALALDR